MKRNNSRITVLFRYDDYCSTSDSNVESAMLDTFSEFHIPCLLGVIPLAWHMRRPMNQAKISQLRDALEHKAAEVALHGFTHEEISARSEFVGLSFDQQVDRITQGRAILEDLVQRPVTAFIPPWNRHDSNTVEALDQLGFKLLSASMRHAVTDAQPQSLRFVPLTCRPQELKAAVDAARHVVTHKSLIVVVLHDYIFVERDKDKGHFDRHSFRQLIAWLASQQDVSTSSFGDLLERPDDLRIEQLKDNIEARQESRRWPGLAERDYSSFLYLDSAGCRQLKRRRKQRLALRVLVALLLVCGVALAIAILLH